MINKKSKVFIAGHNGMVGSAVLRKLKNKGFSKIILSDKKNMHLVRCASTWIKFVIRN